MFFYLAKVLWFLLQPSTLIALLIGYGAILIWTGWARWGRRFVTVGAVLLLLAGLSPLGNALILPLEDRFPRANLDAPPAPTGFIVLGGAEDRLSGGAACTGPERGWRAHPGDRRARPQNFPRRRSPSAAAMPASSTRWIREADGAGGTPHRMGVARGTG